MEAVQVSEASEPRLGLRPGDLVEVLSESEIRATLDETGALEALPFMPEMLAYCGKRARVFKRTEKIWDMTGGTGLRRLRDTVLLEGFRCNGGFHEGCQAGCYLLWKEAWLRRVEASVASAPSFDSERATFASNSLHQLVTRRDDEKGPRYVCQATELSKTATLMHQGDPRHYLRELLVGNVGPLRFIEGVAIALFNWIQRLRGGAGFPDLTPTAAKPTPHEVLNLQPGEFVVVKTKREIEATLDDHRRNRGLFFDLDMLRYCGGRYRVLRRVERLIDERTGRMSEPRTPCIVLEGVVATGEYHAFRAQSEFILWREIWLRRVES